MDSAIGSGFEGDLLAESLGHGGNRDSARLFWLSPTIPPAKDV